MKPSADKVRYVTMDYAVAYLYQQEQNLDILSGMLTSMLGFKVIARRILDPSTLSRFPEDKHCRIDVVCELETPDNHDSFSTDSSMDQPQTNFLYEMRISRRRESLEWKNKHRLQQNEPLETMSDSELEPRPEELILDMNKLALIEVQNYDQHDFLQRTLYGASKIIVDSISKGSAYYRIPKIYHISVIDCTIFQTEGFAFRGMMKFSQFGPTPSQGTTCELPLNDLIQNVFNVKYPENIYPEYLFFLLPEFKAYCKKMADKDNKITLASDLEQWMYFMSTSVLPKDSTAPGLSEAQDRFNYFAMSEAERKTYDEYEKMKLLQSSILQTEFIKRHEVEKANKKLQKNLENSEAERKLLESEKKASDERLENSEAEKKLLKSEKNILESEKNILESEKKRLESEKLRLESEKKESDERLENSEAEKRRLESEKKASEERLSAVVKSLISKGLQVEAVAAMVNLSVEDCKKVID